MAFPLLRLLKTLRLTCFLASAPCAGHSLFANIFGEKETVDFFRQPAVMPRYGVGDKLPETTTRRMATATPSADFVAALHEYQPLLRRVARLYCQDADDRQDLFQEMVLQLWRAWPRYVPQPGAKLSTWLYRIALNVAI